MCIEIDFHLCQNNFVSKRVKTSQIRPRLHCTYNYAMHFGSIQHGRRVTRKNVFRESSFNMTSRGVGGGMNIMKLKA